MDRRGFLKMVTGGAAAVGAALALPRAIPQKTETAAPAEPLTITLPPNHGFTGMTVLSTPYGPNPFHNPYHNPYHNSFADHDGDRLMMRVSRAYGLPIADVAAMSKGEIAERIDILLPLEERSYRQAAQISPDVQISPNYDEDRRIISSGARGDGFRWTRRIHPKPSADLVDW